MEDTDRLEGKERKNILPWKTFSLGTWEFGKSLSSFHNPKSIEQSFYKVYKPKCNSKNEGEKKKDLDMPG